MRRLTIGVLDLVTKGPTRALWARLMHPNLASIMPQAVAVWCRQAGHDVHYICYTGMEDLGRELPRRLDVLFVGAFTQAALLAYAVSALFRRRGTLTVLGGPHARCYPDDAVRYFDYVLGFTDRELIDRVLRERAPGRPLGAQLSASGQPRELPTLEERWPYVEATLAKCPTRVKAVPMIASLGCPYTCSFCIDSVVDYQAMEMERLSEDLRFLSARMPDAWVGWHDPNFGVRFDETMDAIEKGRGGSRLTFVAESSLSLLSEPRLRRLRDLGFQAMLPGIESWYSLGNKSKTGKRSGMEKVRAVSEHVNTILRYVPYVQTNFVLGLDDDDGGEPFELTKRFIDLTPGAFPGYSLLSAFGEAAPLNLELQRAERVLPFPFHFLNNNQAMNVRPLNYEWPEFYDRVIDLTRYTFSPRRVVRRAAATRAGWAKWMNAVRAVSSEGQGRIRYYREIRRRLDEDRPLRRFFDGETDEVPDFYVGRVRRDLGAFWSWLPPGALQHDANAFLHRVEGSGVGAGPAAPVTA